MPWDVGAEDYTLNLNLLGFRISGLPGPQKYRVITFWAVKGFWASTLSTWSLGFRVQGVRLSVSHNA